MSDEEINEETPLEEAEVEKQQENPTTDDSVSPDGALDAEEDDEGKPSGVEFQNFEPNKAISSEGPTEDISLNVILDVPITISMEIGRTQISIRNLLQLNQGSVVELDRLAGEPMDVLVNGTLIARGEVVVANDKFGIRFTDVISPEERIRKLK